MQALTDEIREYLDPEKLGLIERAYLCAKDAHEGQFRRSGDPYIIHPVAVARILAQLRMDHQTIMAALLHDVIEDTEVTKEELSSQFGNTVAELVDGVSKLTQIEFKSKAEAQAHNFQKMTLAMSRDIRVILVKLADRLHNMRTLGPLHPEKRRRIANETLDIYAPIAHRLGINSICVELEDLGFAALHPMRSKYIAKAVKKSRKDHTHIIEDLKHELESCLRARGIHARVVGREKHLNSIYRKMKDKQKSFHEIMDVYAFRILTQSEDECYRALGAVHGTFKPLPYRFKDYIALPKSNGYQSLHTTLFGMHVNIEVQIRTEYMEETANYGIAAHWHYKDEEALPLEKQERIDRWLSGLSELRKNARDSMEFFEHVRIDLFPEEIYVFTPKGNILELPSGATAVDFAYAIHTDLGHTCVACRINKRLSALSQPLASGETVEIITAPGATPSRAWLNFAVTGKAKSCIRNFVKLKTEAEHYELGKQLLDRSLSSIKIAWNDISDAHLEKVLAHNQVETLDALITLVGSGARMPFIIARQLVADEQQSLVSAQVDDSATQDAIMIKGTQGLNLSFANCCHPIPGDPIIGFQSGVDGLIVHAEGCAKARKLSDGREQLHLSWVKDISDDFIAELRVELQRHRGIIAELALAITQAEGSIESISIEEQDRHHSTVSVILHVQGRRQLARIIRRIRRLKAVEKLSRIPYHS